MTQTDARPSITCPRCGCTSWHPGDVQNGYCGCCSWWTSDEHLAGVNPYASLNPCRNPG